MKTSTDGLSILIAYNNYRKNLFFVNRVYQRKLVWTVSEKELLIDSILKQYALPSFLLSKDENKDTFEILDGVQRLSAIFEFIEKANYKFNPNKPGIFQWQSVDDVFLMVVD